MSRSKNKTGHKFKKRFGQNFLQDPNYIQRIIDSCGLCPDEHVIEIGPGEGALTSHIFDSVKSFTIIEIDNELAAKLKQKYSESNNVSIVHQDVLKVDFSSLGIKDKAKVIGNLPYNISTALLFHLFNSLDLFSDMFFMLQKEVAYRLASDVGSSDYGRLTIMANCFCEIEVLFNVPNTAFYPPPKVESAIVHLRPRKESLIKDINVKLLNDIVTSAFSARRKTISNALKGFISQDEIISLDIVPSVRPEQIPVSDYLKITQFLQKRSEK